MGNSQKVVEHLLNRFLGEVFEKMKIVQERAAVIVRILHSKTRPFIDGDEMFVLEDYGAF